MNAIGRRTLLSVEEWLLTRDGVWGNLLEFLHGVLGVGHVPEGEGLELLVGVCVPGHLLVVRGVSVEQLLRPRGGVVVIRHAVRLIA